MKYKRVDKAKNPEESLIQKQWGFLKQLTTHLDPGWIEDHLKELHEDSLFGLHQVSKAVDHAKSLDLKDYKPEAIKERREVPVLAAKRALLTFLKKYIDKAQDDVSSVSNTILRETEPEPSSDPIKLMLRELKLQEVRGLIRQTAPKDRPELIKGNLLFLQACIDSPDQLISDENFIKFRREFAFASDPSLEQWELDTKRIYDAIRKRAGEISATANMMSIEEKIEANIPPAEHFKVFPPRDEHEQALADKMIHTYERKIVDEERKKKIEEQNQRSLDLIQDHPQPDLKRARR
jgi:hypothetical protein